MRRIPLAAAALAAGLTLAASPALADPSPGSPPNCESGQGRAADAALGRGDVDAFMFHLGKLQGCFLGEPAGPPLNPVAP